MTTITTVCKHHHNASPLHDISERLSNNGCICMRVCDKVKLIKFPRTLTTGRVKWVSVHVHNAFTHSLSLHSMPGAKTEFVTEGI